MSDNHGNTPAAWTAVALGLVAFIVAGIGLMVGSWLTFWIGVGIGPFAVIVGSIMSKMGYGASH
jgi:hypothetical protein